jgi:oligosaccharide repeat unit polymerase
MVVDNIIFLIFFIVFIAIWVFISRITLGNIFAVNILGFLNLNIFIFQIVGIPFLYFGLFSDRAEDGITNQSLIFLVLIYSSTSVLLLNVGYFIAKSLFRLENNVVFVNRSDIIPESSILPKVNFVGLICTVFSLVYYYSQGFENLAITAILNNLDASEVAIARSTMTNNYAGNLHWIKFVTNDLFFFVILYLSILFIKNELKNKIFFIVFTFIFSINLLVTTEKAPIIDFLIAILMLKYIFLNPQKLNIYKTAIPFFLILVVLVFVYKSFMPISSLSQVLYSIISRTLGGQVQVAYYYLEFFPNFHPFLNGSSFPNPGGILPFTNFPLTQKVHSWVHPELANVGIIGSMPTIFWGELYANFGLLGVIFLTPIIGIFLYILNWYFNSHNNSFLGLSLFVFLIFHYKNLALSSLSNYIFDLNLILIFIISLIFRIKYKQNG